MKIVFDHQTFTQQSYGGISQYFFRLAQGLLVLGNQIDVVAPLHRNRYLKDLPCASVHGVELERFPPGTGRLAMLANHYLSKLKVPSLAADILHETYYSGKPVSTAAQGRVISVYDIIHEKYTPHFSPRDLACKYKRLAVGCADHVICISHRTKNDLCALFDVPEHKVSVVHLGFEKLAGQPRGAEPPNETVRPFLLYVGSRGGYKNFEGMLKTVALKPALTNAFDVVAFGGGTFTTAAEQSIIAQLGFGPNTVRQVGGGGDDVLGRLYAQARAFVYPSVYEGFGLPPLEAMAHDCRAVTSNSSSMPEVMGDAGAYFDPLDIDAQGRAIASVVFDEQRRGDLISAGRHRLPMFSWERCTRETQVVSQKVLAAKEAH